MAFYIVCSHVQGQDEMYWRDNEDEVAQFDDVTVKCNIVSAGEYMAIRELTICGVGGNRSQVSILKFYKSDLWSHKPRALLNFLIF